jgi:hypothetical protein
MKKTFETSQGEVEVIDAMIDVDGTNLEEGVEIKLDGVFLSDIYNMHVREINKTNIEKIISNLI